MAGIDYEVEYNNRARVPENPALMAGWAKDAAAYREQHAPSVMRYGPGARHIIDFFAGDGQGPIVVFIHGGYWQALDGSSSSHCAKGLNAHGIDVAVPTYDLCPQVSVDTIIQQMRAAARELARLGRPLVIGGHSAGGHLAACLLATDWQSLDVCLPKELVIAAYAISGLFDLMPLVETSINKALQLDPSNSIALRRYALLLATLGDVQESIAMTKQAIDLDPLSGVTWANLGLLLLGDGRMSAAHDAIHRAVEIQPESSYALTDLLDLQLLEGRFADVPETARRHGGAEFSLKSTAMAEHSLGHGEASQQALQELTAKFAKDCAYCIATASAWCGQIDATFQWLQQALEQRESDVVEIKYDPIFISLRGDPRFKALLRKMNLPE